MGKRNFRKGKGGSGFGKRSEVSDRGELWEESPRENEKWELYYKLLNIVPASEWDAFKKACQENLPVTFRITGTKAHAHEIKENFIKNHVSKLKDAEFEGIKLEPRELAYYPEQRAWQMDISKGVIRKNKEFALTQRFLVMETEVGNIYRQEAVSMIPPLLMDIQPHHSVLDMCAAPGSKTAQMVEALHQSDLPPTGFVMANDSDFKRSHMLVHQVKRMNLPNFIVVNHDAQWFPRLKLKDANEFLKFDRILCDVPCSGDGTMRKNVNVWKDFTVGNALGLHPLQINILNRGIQLLKRGGRLVYSTCSLSPIENEAVVAAALRKWGSQIRLVNCDSELPGLVRRQGISDWKVFGKDMQIRERGDESIHESAFPPLEKEAKEFALHNCIRVYPHLQNSGGFFITVIEKVDLTSEDNKRPLGDSTEDELLKRQKHNEDNPLCKPSNQPKQRLPRDANEEPFIFLDADNEQLARCWPFYGISEEFNRDCTLVRNATGEPVRTIYYVAPIIKKILTIEEQKHKIIHAGTKLFVSQRNDSGNCAWRVQNESLLTIKKFLSLKRQLTCNLKLLEVLFTEAFPKIYAIKESKVDEEFSNKLETLEDGCVFLTVSRGEGLEELFLPLWKGRTNVNLMVNKKETQELLYRIYGIGTSAKDKGKEHAYQTKQEGGKSKEGGKAEKAEEAEEAEESVKEEENKEGEESVKEQDNSE